MNGKLCPALLNKLTKQIVEHVINLPFMLIFGTYVG